MRTVIDGVLSGTLPWTFVFSGAALGVAAMVAGLPGLPFALGVYLPFSTNAAVFLGGLIHRVTSKGKVDEETDESNPGILFASGLIAGEGLAGVFIAGAAAMLGKKPSGDPLLSGALGVIGALLILGTLAGLLRKSSRS